MQGVVDFNFSDWQLLYPGFDKITQKQATLFFRQACLILNNSPFSIVRNVNDRELLLYMLVAHQAFIADQINEGGGLVGRISSAELGEARIEADEEGMENVPPYFQQSPYGLQYWQESAQYRQMLMIAGRPHPAKIFP